MRLSMDTSAVSLYYGDEEALRIIRRAGFDCCDFSFCTLDGSVKIGENEAYLSWARHLRSVMDEIGLVCNQAHAPLTLTRENYSADMSDMHYRELVRSMECASVFGAPHIVVHPLGQEGGDSRDFDLRFYQDLEKWCRRFKIKVAIENVYTVDPATGVKQRRLCSAEEQAALVRALGTECFTVLIDIGHAAILGSKPEDYLRRMDPALLGGLHVHDTDFREDLHVPPYHALHDWDAIMKTLGEMDYAGDLSLEIPYYISRFDRALVPVAVRFAEEIGRHLIDRFETLRR